MTQYTEFIKSWAQKHNKSYMCAATDPRAREEYYGSYPKRPTKSKLKQNREKQTAAVMGLMEMGAKAKEDEQKKRQRSAASDLMSMGSKAVAAEASTKAEQVENAAIKAREEAKKATAKAARKEAKKATVEKQKIAAKESAAAKDDAERKQEAKDFAKEFVFKREAAKKAADLARFHESVTNPAAGVLTNPDLLRLIGSFIPTKSDQWVRSRNEFLKRLKKLPNGLDRVNYFQSERQFKLAEKWQKYFRFRAKKNLNWSIRKNPTDEDYNEDDDFKYIESYEAANAVTELINGEPPTMWNDEEITYEIQNSIYNDPPDKSDSWYDHDVYN